MNEVTFGVIRCNDVHNLVHIIKKVLRHYPLDNKPDDGG